MNFGGYHVTFSAGEEPTFLQIAWLTKSNPSFVHLARYVALENRRQELAGLSLIAVEQRKYKAVTFELQLYGRPGAYQVEPIRPADLCLDEVEWPEEV